MPLFTPPATLFAPLPTCLPPGYLLAPKGRPEVGLPELGFEGVGTELERCAAGRRAVEGKGFADGLYDWPEMAVPYDVAFRSIPDYTIM